MLGLQNVSLDDRHFTVQQLVELIVALGDVSTLLGAHIVIARYSAENARPQQHVQDLLPFEKATLSCRFVMSIIKDVRSHSQRQ